jgi:hypothetical protein
LRKQKKAAKSSFKTRDIEDHQKGAMEGSTILPSCKQGANVGESPWSTFAGSLTSSSTGLKSASTLTGHGLTYPMKQNNITNLNMEGIKQIWLTLNWKSHSLLGKHFVYI